MCLCQARWKISTPHDLPLDKVGCEGALQMIATIPAEADVGEVAALKGTVAATATELQVSKDPAGQSGGGGMPGVCCNPC